VQKSVFVHHSNCHWSSAHYAYFVAKNIYLNQWATFKALLVAKLNALSLTLLGRAEHQHWTFSQTPHWSQPNVNTTRWGKISGHPRFLLYQLYFASTAAQYKNTEYKNKKKDKLYTDKNPNASHEQVDKNGQNLAEMSGRLCCYKQQQHSKLLAQFVFKVSVFCFNTCAKSRAPLTDCRINNALIQFVPSCQDMQTLCSKGSK